MTGTRVVLITSLLALSSVATTNEASADECDTKWMACQVGCTSKDYGKNDPMMLQGCKDSCDASRRLCESFRR
jgi:hypothetical protein